MVFLTMLAIKFLMTQSSKIVLKTSQNLVYKKQRINIYYIYRKVIRSICPQRTSLFCYLIREHSMNRSFVQLTYLFSEHNKFSYVGAGRPNIPSGVAGQLISTPYSTQCTVYTKRQQRVPTYIDFIRRFNSTPGIPAPISQTV